MVERELQLIETFEESGGSSTGARTAAIWQIPDQ